MPSRDILFPALGTGLNPAELGPSGPFIRTTGTGPEARFGPFFVSLRSLSLTQPNHAHFGTVSRSPTNQWVRGHPKGRGLKELRSGGVNTGQTIRFGTDL